MNTSTRFNKAKELVAAGATVQDAIKQVGMTHGAYYAQRSKSAGKPKKHTKKKLEIQTIPMVTIDAEKLFMVYGTPNMLANFARGLQ